MLFTFNVIAGEGKVGHPQFQNAQTRRISPKRRAEVYNSLHCLSDFTPMNAVIT
jgi:hypothetical protein